MHSDHRNIRAAGFAQGIILASAPVFAMLGAVLIAPVLAQIQVAFHSAAYATVLVPLLLTAPALLLALLSPFAGYIADRIGARRVFLWSLALYGLTGTAPLYLHSLAAIFTSRLLVGVAEAGLVTAATALLSDFYAGDDRQKWFAYQYMILPMIAAALLAATGLISDIGWRLTFGVYALSLVALLLGWIYLFDPINATSKREKWRMPSWRHLCLIGGIAIPGSIAFYVAPVEVAFLLKQQGATAASTASDVIAVGLIASPLGPLLSRRLTHLPVGQLLSMSMAGMAAGIALMGSALGISAIAIGIAVQQIAGGLMLVTGKTYVLGLANEGDRGVYSGAWWFFYMAAQFVTPIILTGLLLVAGTPAHTVLMAAALVAASCLWLPIAPALRRRLVSKADAHGDY